MSTTRFLAVFLLIIPGLLAAQPGTMKITGPDSLCRPGIGAKEVNCIALGVSGDAEGKTLRWTCDEPGLRLTGTLPDGTQAEPGNAQVRLCAFVDSLGIDKDVHVNLEIIGAGDTIRLSKTIRLYGGRLYYLPDFTSLKESGVFKSKEEENLAAVEIEECEYSLWDAGNYTYENDKLIVEKLVGEVSSWSSSAFDPSMTGDFTQMNRIRKLWDENGVPYPPGELMQFRDYVFPAPCASRYFSMQGWDGVLQLAQEGQDRMSAIDAAIKATQAQVTADNYAVMGEKIKGLEAAKEEIPGLYAPRIDSLVKGTMIIYDFVVTDTAAHYVIKEVVVTGARWNKKHDQPWLEVSIRFEAYPSYVTITQWDGKKVRFREDHSQFTYSLVDAEGKTISKQAVPVSVERRENGEVISWLPLSRLMETDHLDFARSFVAQTKLE